jgi:uncharacterized protein YwqG
MRQNLITEIQNTDAEEVLKKKCIESINDRYIIEATSQKELKTGDSKFGGFPDLAYNTIYPCTSEYTYEFVCQLNLEDIDGNNLLPKTGLISFFIGDDFIVTNTPNKVIFQPNKYDLNPVEPPLVPKSICESFEGRDRPTSTGMNLTHNVSINQNLLDQLLDSTAINSVIENCYSRNQVLGY